MGQQNHTRSAPKDVRVRVSFTGQGCLLIMPPLRSTSGRRQSSSTCQKRAAISLPARDQVLVVREPSTRWPSRASSSTSRTAQFSTRSLVMTRQLAENRPHVWPFCDQMRSQSLLFGPVWYPIYAGKGHLREKTQPRKPVDMRVFYPKKGPSHFSLTVEIIDINSFTKYTGRVRLGHRDGPGGCSKLASLFLLLAEVSGAVVPTLAPRAEVNRTPTARQPSLWSRPECALSSTGLSAVVRALCVRIPDGLPICAEPLPF